jgi:cation diffusion facilitator family transporter
VRALTDPRELTNLGWVLVAAVVGGAGNEAVARYRIRVGRRIGSAALVAEGQHARTDALTSLAVLAGAAGAWFGWPQADAVVGLVIAGVIIVVLARSLRTTLVRLMDGVDHGTLDRFEEIASTVPGVLTVEHARARWVGHRMEADVQVLVDPTITVRASDTIAHDVADALTTSVPNLDHVDVHACPAAE